MSIRGQDWSSSETSSRVENVHVLSTQSTYIKTCGGRILHVLQYPCRNFGVKRGWAYNTWWAYNTYPTVGESKSIISKSLEQCGKV